MMTVNTLHKELESLIKAGKGDYVISAEHLTHNGEIIPEYLQVQNEVESVILFEE